MVKKRKSPEKKASPKKRIVQDASLWKWGLICAVFGFLLYANTLGHGYVLDDQNAIKENFVTKQGVTAIPTIFTTHYRHGYWNKKGTLYRPIPLSMFAFEWQLSPDNAFFSHFMNALIYGTLGFLLFFLLARSFPDHHWAFSLMVTLLFLAHPVHTEAVANIKSRDEILPFLFLIGSLLSLKSYVSQKKMLHLGMSIGLYLLALFSKESAITYLAIFPLYLHFFTRESLVDNLKLSGLFLIPAVLFVLIRAAVLGDITGIDAVSRLDNMLAAAPDGIAGFTTAIMLQGKYLWTQFIPYSLAADHGYAQIPYSSLGDWKFWLAFIVHVGLGVWAVLQIPKRNKLAFGILFYIVTMSISSNVIITIGTSYAERLLFSPSFGFVLTLVSFLFLIFKVDLSQKQLPALELMKNHMPAFGILAFLILAFSLKTIDRNADWESQNSLYSQDIITSPNSAKMQYYYGLEMVQNGLKEKDKNQKGAWIKKGVDAFTKALSIYPSYNEALSQRGLAYFRLGDQGKALADYEKCIEGNPNNANVLSNMGIIYFTAGQLGKAQDVYEKAVKIDPRFVDARRNLGSTFARQGKHAKAIEQFREALKYKPDSAILHYYLGLSLKDNGEMQKAQVSLEKAFKLDPSLRPK